MVNKLELVGYKAFREFVQNLTTDKVVNFYFSGTKGPDGKSWCDDCVAAEPFVNDALNKAPSDSLFVYVDVGERKEWKDINNDFRKDKDVHLVVIPTLVRWKGPQRLEGPQCEKPDILEMFFTDE